MEGPLMLDFGRRSRRIFPKIENSELSGRNPPNLHRFRLWRKAAIAVGGRPDWLFIKLHCHGMDPCDQSAMIGAEMQSFLSELDDDSENGSYKVHFVTAREMTNIALAACDGRTGNPGEYRDYRFHLITPSASA
jgi:hypothetical protein